MTMSRREFNYLLAMGAASALAPNMASAAQPANQPGGPYPADFQKVHDRLIVIDGAVPLIGGSLNPKHFDWYREGGCTAISVTVAGGNYEQDVTTTVLSWMARQIQTRPELMLVRTADDILAAKREGKLGIFYHFQGPSALGIDLGRVWYYKQAGVGVIQFAYNTRNPYANGITERVDAGLSVLGQRLVRTCNEARVIVDVAHTGAKSALDAIGASSDPVILSHGNAYGKIKNARNVPDEVLKAVAKNGGFAGAVGYPPFVSTQTRPTMEDMVGMIDYMVQLIGIDHVSIGVDYDQTTNGAMPADKVKAQYDALVASGAWDPKAYPPPPYYYPKGIELPNTLYNLTGALLKRGYSIEDVGKIWGGNWLRVMKQVWSDPKAKPVDDVTIDDVRSTLHEH